MAEANSTDNSQSNIALDLDTLAPQAAQIAYKGKNIPVPALDLPDYAKLMDISGDLKSLTETDEPTKVMPVYDKIRALIDQLIPELKDERLNLNQLVAIFNMLIQINSPQDKAVAELEKRGISVKGGDGDPKGSTSSEPSQSSLEATPATQ